MPRKRAIFGYNFVALLKILAKFFFEDASFSIFFHKANFPNSNPFKISKALCISSVYQLPVAYYINLETAGVLRNAVTNMAV